MVDEFKYCSSCGKPSALDARFCKSCGAVISSVRAVQSSPQKRKNRYDESVKEWFISKTFKTLLTIGLIGGCCFASCSFLFYGSLVKLFDNLLSLPPEYQSSISTQQASTQRPSTQQATLQQVLQEPHIAGETNPNHPIDNNTKAALNTWLATSAPVDTPYWFVTYWHRREDDGSVFVSLAGVDLSSADEKWHMDGEPNGENKVMWSGSIDVFGNNVTLYQP